MASRNAVITEIDDLFENGKRAAEDDIEFGTHTECPVTTGSLWWKRGYSYTWRLFRAISAETELKSIRSAIKPCEASTDYSTEKTSVI